MAVTAITDKKLLHTFIAGVSADNLKLGLLIQTGVLTVEVQLKMYQSWALENVPPAFVPRISCQRV